MAKTRPAICWGVRMHGYSGPYIAPEFIAKHKSNLKAKVPSADQPHSGVRAVRVAVVPLAQYQRLLKLDKRQGARDA